MRKLRHNERLVQGQTEKPAADLGTPSLLWLPVPSPCDCSCKPARPRKAHLPNRQLCQNPGETFCDSQAKSLRMTVGQHATISLILHTKERTSLLCFNCTRISSKHRASPQKRTVSLESNTCIILHFQSSTQGIKLIVVNPKQLDTLRWDHESYPWSIISSGDFVPRLAESWKRPITAPRENKVGEVLGQKT